MNRPRVIRGGRVLDLDAGNAPEKDVLIVEGRIAEIGPPALPAPDGAEEVDARDRLLTPGLVNAHTHAHGVLGKGLCGDRWPLELLLNANPASNRGRSVDDKHLCGLLNAVELVRRGCTATFDMFAEFPAPSPEGVHAVASAYEAVGIRAVVAPMIADRTLYRAIPGLLEALPDTLREEVAAIRAAPGEISLDVCKTIYENWSFDRSFIRPGVAPTIPLHCSDDFLAACGRMSADYALPLQTHLAESQTQALSGPRAYGRSLTRHLQSLGVLSPRASAAHAIWLDEDDARILSDEETSVVHNPLSNARLGSGIADISTYRAAGVNVAIGTDAANTSDSLNMFEAARWAAYFTRLRHADRARWVDARDALRMATEGGARVLGFDGMIGKLAPGYEADIVFLDLGHITYTPLNDVVRQIVYGESGASVVGVMIAGRDIMANRAMLTVNEADLREKAQEASDRLRRTNAEAREFVAKLEQYVAAFCLGLVSDHGACPLCKASSGLR